MEKYSNNTMRKKTITLLQRAHKALTLMVMLCMALLATAQVSEVTINSPSANSNWVPCYLTYNNTRAEMIYNASQLSALGEGKTITSVAFDGVSNVEVEDVDFTLYVKETSSAQTLNSHSTLLLTRQRLSTSSLVVMQVTKRVL